MSVPDCAASCWVQLLPFAKSRFMAGIALSLLKPRLLLLGSEALLLTVTVVAEEDYSWFVSAAP